MKTKLVWKLLFLLIGLVIVVMVRNVTESGGFKNSVNSLFGIQPTRSLNWCAEHVVDVEWKVQVVSPLAQLDMADLRSKICELKTEDIAGINLDEVKWSPLAESHGAAGAKTLLEWNADLGVFRSGGMPFKSSDFLKELKN